MSPNDADRMANSVDPNQTAPALFAQTCLSENLGTLRYPTYLFNCNDLAIIIDYQ